MIHPDQGTQDGCDAWRRFCRFSSPRAEHEPEGNCWDNAVAESFFSSLKKERLSPEQFEAAHRPRQQSLH